MPRYRTTIAKDAQGRVYLPVPFDPDAQWGAKPRHHVRGVIGPAKFRGPLAEFDGGWGLPLGPAWRRDCEVRIGDAVEVLMDAEGPQAESLAPDVAAALAADPQAAAFFHGLATFYRKGYLRWIDATKRRPDVRTARIAEMIELLKAGRKTRPAPKT
ncbi:YdeI/OmpD-associated family protein [Phenylobacterium sp.]|uniref:YdeI/OmpD-associated family protein n=1 Tax=Phenylobacterium sp. TaxID=1871053 RepID=UPI002CE17618|nr:YdeI/OmpD-associated family protein [Phenylobacterium sp.]HLZ75962.1 YdeI/OmpD-associated family protein [Phenylobacterium sp.]